MRSNTAIIRYGYRCRHRQLHKHSEFRSARNADIENGSLKEEKKPGKPEKEGDLREKLVDPPTHLSDHIEKNAGKPAEYNPSHIYEAVVIGEGKTLKARVYDGGGYSDNHGELRISVYQAV